MYANGIGVKRDLTKAIDLFRKDCNAGGVQGCDSLATHYKIGLGVAQNHSKSKMYFDKACNGGYSKACYSLKNY